MDLTRIFHKYAKSVIPIGWVYYENTEKAPMLEAKSGERTIYIHPCATAFLLSINEDSSLLATANHAFPDLEKDRAEICFIIPSYLKCPLETTMDDLKLYLGVKDFIRLEEQDVCIIEIDTPEALYLQQPTPIPLGLDFDVGDEVCTIGYPFIGNIEDISSKQRDIRFVERLTYAHLSAIVPSKETMTLEFDNYIGPGNSGGPLINIRTGDAIGIATSIRKEERSMTTFSHATCIMELERARNIFPNMPYINPKHR